MSLAQSRIAVVGLGLMGGSLALALKDSCAALYGVDPDVATLELARRLGAVDACDSRPEAILPQADVVVLAAPVGEILKLLVALPGLHPGPAIVLDLGSTKGEIVQAMAGLPERFDSLGGHPMCGKEQGGLANASADLFQGAAFAFTALPRTSPAACALVEELALAVGARPLWLEAGTHDRWTAATSHLPYLLACALALATPEEVAPLVGPGFRSTSRVAGTSPAVMLPILQTNTGEVKAALKRFRKALDGLEEALKAEDWPALEGLLRQAGVQQRTLAGGDKR